MGYLYLFNELDYRVIPWYRLIIEEAEMATDGACRFAVSMSILLVNNAGISRTHVHCCSLQLWRQFTQSLRNEALALALAFTCRLCSHNGSLRIFAA